MNKKDEWGTPIRLFNELDNEFNFNLDPCSSKNRLLKPNIKCYYKEDDGLQQNWNGKNVFVNPPYSGNNIKKWIKKCYEEKDRANIIVLLIPATKTGTKYFHRYVIPHAEIRFVAGRINFIPLSGQNDNSNPLYSLLCIFRKVGDSQ
jgi:site-specific DNA-methyltransferase (adenine-specific)